MEALNLQTPFLSDLADAGFPREEVDTVICTHLHFDHVGWNTMLVDGEWVPTFPNARYLLCRDEWEHWNREGASGYAATIDDAVRPVVDAGLADLVASDHRVTDEIRLEATPGHTPGHVAVHVESGGRHALDHRRPRAPSRAVRRTRLVRRPRHRSRAVVGHPSPAPRRARRHRPAGDRHPLRAAVLGPDRRAPGTDTGSRRLHPGMPDTAFPLSVLDLAPVGRGSTPADALRNSIALVQETERLGYRRHWVAEHHNMPGIASSSPPVLLAHLASVTSTIRLGSGGVMLPNHSALAVAEQFGMLEALHPGRIDLGIGRAPGTDPLTASALRRGPELLGADDFPEQMTELIGYFEGALPEGHRYERITAVPARGYKPALWMLGSSTYGASAAAVLGLPYSFAYHFAPAMLDDALAVYRRTFRPSAELDAPYVMLGVSVICGESDEHAHRLAKPGQLAFLRLRQGRPDVYPTPEEAAEYTFTPLERQFVDDWTRSHVDRRRGDGARRARRRWSSAPAPTSSWCRRWRPPTRSGWRPTPGWPTPSRSAPPADRASGRPQRPDREHHAHRGDTGVRQMGPGVPRAAGQWTGRRDSWTR